MIRPGGLPDGGVRFDHVVPSHSQHEEARLGHPARVVAPPLAGVMRETGRFELVAPQCAITVSAWGGEYQPMNETFEVAPGLAAAGEVGSRGP